MLSGPELLLVITGTIGAVASAVVTIINAVTTKKKLRVIHQDTNGNLTHLKRELAAVKLQLAWKTHHQQKGL